MEFNLTTPALLFPANSLLMLVYTNRFLSLANIIRRLHADYTAAPKPAYLKQIEKLRWRIKLVQNMQFCGILSLLLCTVSMGILFYGPVVPAEVVFALSLLVMCLSLVFALIEIHNSVLALDVHLQDLEHPEIP